METANAESDRIVSWLVGIGLAVGLWSGPALAHASACPMYDLEPTDLEIEKEPSEVADCVTVSVRGKWQSCNSPRVVLRNECSEALTLSEATTWCGTEKREEECATIEPGEAGNTGLGYPGSEKEEKAVSEYSGSIGDDEVTIRVKYHTVDRSPEEGNGLIGGEGCGCGADTAQGAPAHAMLFLIPLLGFRSWRRYR